MTPEELWIRASEPVDAAGILTIINHIELFSLEEVACIKELWDVFLTQGPLGDGYNFLTAIQSGAVVGFACFGHRPLTDSSFDLYWIAVDKALQHHGVGSALLKAVEAAIQTRAGHLIIIETSGEEGYLPTRRFYEAHGYRKEADIPDFYKPGDSLILYCKTFSRPPAGPA